MDGRKAALARRVFLLGISSAPRSAPAAFCFFLSTPPHTMLEAFEILTTSGVVLWSKSYAPVGPHIVNSLINDVFIEERVRPQRTGAGGASPIFKKEKYTLKWKIVKDFNLIFVVCLLAQLLALRRN